MQRVAIARAVVIEPHVLLLDEPLSNLDAKLRVEMRVEIRRLQKALGITVIYVTHDQEEALSMSDRIAVMRSGRIEQVAAPRPIYEQPATPFVASFVGTTNLLQGVIQRRDGAMADILVAGSHLRVKLANGRVGDRVTVSMQTGNAASARAGRIRSARMDRTLRHARRHGISWSGDALGDADRRRDTSCM